MASQADVKAKLDALQAGVAPLDDVESSVEQLLTNMAGQITSLKTAAANADVPQAFLDQIDAIQTALTADKDKLVKAVTANTPAA